jgi:hypothetical protein
MTELAWIVFHPLEAVGDSVPRPVYGWGGGLSGTGLTVLTGGKHCALDGRWSIGGRAARGRVFAIVPVATCPPSRRLGHDHENFLYSLVQNVDVMKNVYVIMVWPGFVYR